MKVFLTMVLAVAVTASFGKSVTVDVEKSTVKWTGKKVAGEHFGNIDFKKGSFKVSDGKIVEGEFHIDMNSITCTDIESDEWNKKLVGHLKSDDFFGVEQFPVAKLKVVESSQFVDGVAKVKAHLTIKGVTEPVSFKVKMVDEGFASSLKVDRTKYNVKYGSGKFFDNLGDNMINDEFKLEVNIVAL